MCLIKRSKSKPQISKRAEKDIIVFKCMKKIKSLVVSPFKFNRYSRNKKHIAPSCRLKDDGGFYSFKTIKSALKFKNSRWIKGENTKIFKCIIPKGSSYIEGYQTILIWNNETQWYNKHLTVRAIRSKQIIFSEEVIR